MTVRRIELAGYWDSNGERTIKLDTTGGYIMMPVATAQRLLRYRCPELAQELRAVLSGYVHEHE